MKTKRLTLAGLFFLVIFLPLSMLSVNAQQQPSPSAGAPPQGTGSSPPPRDIQTLTPPQPPDIPQNVQPVPPVTPPNVQQSASPSSPSSATPRQRLAPSAPQAQGNLVQMNFDNIELRDLIRFISSIMGKNFLFDENVIKGKVTILSPKNLAKDEVFRVFTSVMNYFGFSVVMTPEAVKIVKGTDAKTMAIESLTEEAISKLPPEDRFITYVYNLSYLDPNVMVGVLRPLLSRDAYIVGIPATGSLIMIDTASNIQRVRQLLVDIDIPVSKQLGSIKVYDVQHTNAVELGKTLQTLLAEGKKAATPKEKIFITSYASTNTLLISAPPEDMEEIMRIIAAVDTLRPQVLVEAAIIEVTVSRGEEFGVEWIGSATASGNRAVGGFVQSDGSVLGFMNGIINQKPEQLAQAFKTGLDIGVIGNQISFNGNTYATTAAFIRALSTRDNVNILSTPQLLTVNNEEAEIVVGENRPYLTSTRVDASGNPLYSYDYRDVGVKLKIKPYINKDGFVNLNIYQEVSKVTQATTQGTGSVPAPTTLKRSTKTTVVVRDNQTVVISGLIRDDSTGTQQGVPFLSQIPVIGYLFGYKQKSYEKTNLLVFLTPKIIYTAESLEVVSTEKKQGQDKLIKERKQ